MICPNCKAVVSDNSKFCNNCGYDLRVEKPAINQPLTSNKDQQSSNQVFTYNKDYNNQPLPQYISKIADYQQIQSTKAKKWRIGIIVITICVYLLGLVLALSKGSNKSKNEKTDVYPDNKHENQPLESEDSADATDTDADLLVTVPSEWDLSMSNDERIIALPSRNEYEGKFYAELDGAYVDSDTNVRDELKEKGYSYLEYGLKNLNHNTEDYRSRIIKTSDNGLALRQTYYVDHVNEQEKWYYEEYIFPVYTDDGVTFLLTGYCYEKSAGNQFRDDYINVFIPGITVFGDQKFSVERTSSDTEETDTDVEPQPSEESEKETADTIISIADDQKNMHIGDICKDNNLYVGLSYAKVSSTFMTTIGEEEEIASDSQVLFAFFDVYNAGINKENIDDHSFSCYVDGISYNKVDTYFYYVEDGITNQYSSDLYNNTCKIVITDFEIPKEWHEIKLYYGSDYIWSLSPEDVSTEPFEFSSMYDVDYEQEPTSDGAVIYSEKYEVIYDGYEYYTGGYFDTKYIVFKFTVNNTGTEDLDYSLAGYDMNCYLNNYVTLGSDYSITDKIDGHRNIYNVDTIHAGMSAKLYVAFEIDKEHDFYRMIYNPGYISEEHLADVYIKAEGDKS